MRPAHRALVCWVGGAVAYNVLAEDHETISEGIDELLARYPLMTRILVILVSAHLINLLSERFDIIHVSFIGLRRGIIHVRTVRYSRVRKSISRKAWIMQ